MEPKVTIIILNWNGTTDTIECVESLNKITYKNYKVIIIDNGSSTDEKNKLEQLSIYNNVNIIYNSSNLGFTGGNNIGIKSAIENNTDFILLLNNDTIVKPDFIEPLLTLFDKEAKTAIVAPQINYYNKRDVIWSEGGKISWLRGSGFAYSDRKEGDKIPEDKEVGFVSGCCMLIKKELFEKTGLFDDKFFLYVEDTDLCFRTRKAGFRIFISHKSKIYHKVGQSTQKELSEIPLYYVTRNRLYFAKKNFVNNYFFIVIYLMTIMTFKSIYWVLTGRFRNLFFIRRAFSDFYNDKMFKLDIN